MATFETVMSELKELRNHFDSGFSATERDRIDKLCKKYLGHGVENKTCGDCYRDAFLQLRSTLSKLGRLPEERNYALKEGNYLHTFGSDDYITEPTDEQAERYLAQYPGAIARFSKYPENWEERVENRKKNIQKTKVARAKREAKKTALAEPEQ